MSLAPSRWMDGRGRLPRGQAALSRQRPSSNAGSWAIPFLYVLNLAGFALLTFLPGIVGASSTPISIAFRVVVVAVSAFLVLYGIHHHRLQLGRPGWVFLIFWTLYLIRLLDNTLLEPVLGLPSYIYWSFSIGIVIIPCLAFFLRPRIKDLNVALIALQVALLIVGLASLLFGMSALRAEGRLNGNDTQNPIELGHIGAAMVICGAFSLLSGRHRGIWLRVLNYASLGCGMIVLFLSGSRGPLVGLAAVIALWAVASLRSQFSARKQIFVLIFIAVAGYSSVIAVERTQSDLFARLEFLKSAQNRQQDRREALLAMGAQQFLDSPWLGSAIEVYGNGYPHDVILESFMALGVFGGLLFTGIFLYGFLRTFKLISSTHPAAWVGMLYIQYAVGGVFSGTIYDNFSFWYLYAALSVVPVLQYRQLITARRQHPPGMRHVR